MAMFERRKSKLRAHDAQQADQRFERNERSGKDIYSRLTELRGLPREGLVAAVFMLSMAAKQQSQTIQRSMEERAKAEFDFESPPNGDVATYLASATINTLRDNTTDAPGVLDLLFERLPEVRFTVHQQEAVSMLAAMIREQHIEGVLEGLRLAGLLNESSRDRHAGMSTIKEELG
jgi:hypothetical protein